MSVTALDSALSNVERLAIDSAPIIYFIEKNPRYLALVDEVFRRVDEGSLSAVTSTITLTEVLTRPLQVGNRRLRDVYLELLLEAEHLEMVSIDSGIAAAAAELRARYSIRTPDALQIACAVTTDCQAFLTNDSRLQKISDVRVLVLESLVRRNE